MEKTRVPRGEEYWFINGFGDIMSAVDEYLPINNRHYNLGNYFHTKEEAESMACKLRAVLKGAEVIEVPSESDIVTERDLRMNACDVYGEFEPAFQDGFYECYEYLKSKIVK